MTFFSNAKRKNYVLNPRGKALYDDGSRFGTKMLEKMGWSKGKGLGANLDGKLEFIKISHKSDQKGVGFKDKDDQWTSHESNFNALLNSFKSAENSDEGTENFQNDDKAVKNQNSEKKTELLSGVSLEEQSKKSRFRVHYKKFTRGKDLSKCSAKDLANIFGKKTLNSAEKLDFNSVSSDAKKEKKEETMETIKNFGISTIDTGTTINDYFKNKMKRTTEKENLCSASEKTEDHDTRQNIKNSDFDHENVSNSVNHSKRSRKRKLDKEIEEAKPPKKKRKNVAATEEVIDIRDDESISENVLTPQNSLKDERNGVSVEEEHQLGKERKKKKNLESLIEIFDDEPVMQLDNEESFILSKSKKSKRKKDADFSTSKISLEEKSASSNSGIVEVTPFGIEKKKKNVDLVNETFPDKPVMQPDVKVSFASKKSKKSNRKQDSTIKNVVVKPTEKQEALFDQSPKNLFNWASELEKNENWSTVVSSNVYEIRRYRAEVFRYVDLHAFAGSTLCDIPGYGYTSDMTLNIIEKENETRKIHTLWNQALNKYADGMKKKKFVELIEDLKKKNIFKI